MNNNSAEVNKRFSFDVNLTPQKTNQCKDCASWMGVCKRGKARIAADQSCELFELRIAARWYL